jgi:hypothetical protein
METEPHGLSLAHRLLGKQVLRLREGTNEIHVSPSKDVTLYRDGGGTSTSKFSDHNKSEQQEGNL